jgi:hypothetical protein
MIEANDFNDTLGAGSYPEPPEEKEKNVSGQVTITFNIRAEVPEDWDDEDIEEDIKERLSDYVDLNDYRTIDVEVY